VEDESMFSDTMNPISHQMHDARREQSDAASVSGEESDKWSVSARLQLIILPAAGIWGLVIWIATSLI
jgi:hypothetical protein